VEGLQLGDHVCALVDGVDDGFEVIAETVAVGLAAGDRVRVFTESVPRAQVLARLGARGIPAGRESRVGQLEVLSAGEAYRPSGRFERDRLLESLVGHVERATLDGYAGLRLVGDMAWAPSAPVGVEHAPAGVHVRGCRGPVVRILDCPGITAMPAVHLSRATGTELAA
jgi:MEDS: MEthanogen/methylotroph, DcmR Sensory domain